MTSVCLVSCTRTKAEDATLASEMYTSPLFQKERAFASQFDKWYILSAKYGLLDPTHWIEPYELSLHQMTREERRRWAEDVSLNLFGKLAPGDEVTILAGEYYRKDLVPLLANRGFRVHTPLEGKSIGRQLSWLKQRNAQDERVAHLNRLYELIQVLEWGLGGKRLLGESTGSLKWPRRGVYLIFEPGEARASDPDMLRVVRVGTHAVSHGSQSTLWGRLRTHKGTDSCAGNHRSSIFRLHVGAAMIAKKAIEMPSWGIGQTSTPLQRLEEGTLERSVSQYIADTSVLWLEINDNPGPESDRSFIEKNLLGLLMGPLGPLDVASPHWLGNFSPNRFIRISGLWNVDHIFYPYDTRFIEVFEEYVNVTLGKSLAPTGSLAPRNWFKRGRRPPKRRRRQLSLF